MDFGGGNPPRERLGTRGHRKTGATEVRAKGGCRALFDLAFGFARGRTPLLFRIFTTEF